MQNFLFMFISRPDLFEVTILKDVMYFLRFEIFIGDLFTRLLRTQIFESKCKGNSMLIENNEI